MSETGWQSWRQHFSRRSYDSYEPDYETVDASAGEMAGLAAPLVDTSTIGSLLMTSSPVLAELTTAATSNLTSGLLSSSSPGVALGGLSDNATDTDTYTDVYFRHSPTLTVVYCVAYCTVFIIGVVGNCFVVAVVLRSPRMKNVTNILICNLALADMIIIFCLPATLMGNIFSPWVLGWFACKTVPYMQGLSVSASINTLVAISMDRFLAICYPMRWQITTRICRIIIVIIWVFSVLITLPWAIYFTLIPMNPDEEPDGEGEPAPSDPDRLVCVERWPDERSDATFFVLANMLLLYLIPLSIISVCYCLIWVKVWTRKLPGETKGQGTDEMIQKSKIKVIKMLMTVVVMFALSWLPLYAIFTRVKCGEPFSDGSLESSIVEVAVPIAQWLGASNSCINPILYAFFNNKFRAGFKALLTGNRCCGPLRYDFAYKGSTFRSNSTCASKMSKGSKNSVERRAAVANYNNSTPV